MVTDTVYPGVCLLTDKPINEYLFSQLLTYIYTYTYVSFIYNFGGFYKFNGVKGDNVILYEWLMSLPWYK